MDIAHIHDFTAAMTRKDLDAMLSHMAENIVLRTPLLPEPVKGKTAIREVVSGLLRVVESFNFREIMQGPEHVSSFFTVRAGGHELDGMDYWRLDDTGLIQEMTVLWRPLPAIAAVASLLS
ncbi:nuclear transport factor 2 family protein [Rhizosaccharibacter radicis]|uniref:Nuclear transport factor 2 family protein n=1 Tax=Rhizosaccharibacter radicis TaxID=2782605 RepID=A0ABT1VYV1_9PROT|nr:nuclear transport factor 2 family protein [Acetobacteraceae bacterium KSS12]